MVSETDRDYMWQEYAPPDPRMKCNIGIRRRLAPLVDGELPPRVHLLHALLLALPGSPVLYYGDEIGMGDNIWLHDRDGVRTPMQWNDGGRGRLLRGRESDFYLPLVQDPGYAKERVNVEQQMLDPGSLLVWLRAMLVIRRRHPVFGLGTFEDLGGGENEAVFAFLRTMPFGSGASHRGDLTGAMAVLCVNNLSASPQTITLDLSRFRGPDPVQPAQGRTASDGRRGALRAARGAARVPLAAADGGRPGPDRADR